jgi:hypothetical protein
MIQLPVRDKDGSSFIASSWLPASPMKREVMEAGERARRWNWSIGKPMK